MWCYNTSRDDCTAAGAYAHEESPSFTVAGCQLTAGKGDFKESATENYRNQGCKDEKAR